MQDNARVDTLLFIRSNINLHLEAISDGSNLRRNGAGYNDASKCALRMSRFVELTDLNEQVDVVIFDFRHE